MNKCSQCINCEKIEYTDRTQCLYMCHQANIVLSNEQLTEGCKCFELEESRMLGGVWEIDLHKIGGKNDRIS